MAYIPGVDRSHHNSPTPLASLVAKGIKFVFFKATDGLTYIDPTFNTSWQEAKNTPGLYRGAYHFFQPQVDGIAQAEHYLSLGMSFSASGALPPCVDLEDLVGSDDDETKQLNQWVANNWTIALQRFIDFLTHVKDKTGKDCIIYTYNNYPKEYFHGHGFTSNPMWLSSLQETCPKRYDTGQLPEFWQNTYNWNGTDQDGDYFIGTQSDLDKLANIA